MIEFKLVSLLRFTCQSGVVIIKTFYLNVLHGHQISVFVLALQIFARTQTNALMYLFGFAYNLTGKTTFV